MNDLTEDREACPTCGGVGTVVVTKFKKDDRVIYATGGHWGNLPATVLSVSKSGKRIRIKTDPRGLINGGNPWISWVTPHKLDALT